MGLTLIFLSLFAIKFIKIASTDPDGAVDMLFKGIHGFVEFLV